MVYCGKPSGACETCRGRKVKCDEIRPTCNECARLRLECGGYRDVSKLIFRNKTSSTETRAAPKRRSSKAKSSSSTISAASSAQTTPDRDVIESSLEENTEVQLISSRSPDLVPILSRTLPQDPTQLALSFFFSEFIVAPRNLEASRGYLEYLHPLFSTTSMDSPLASVTKAIAFASFAGIKGMQQFKVAGRRNYVQAISRTKAALSDPRKSQSNEILLTVLLFGLYESLTCTFETLPSWANHNDGAVALIRSRGPQMLQDPVSTKLFFSVRAQMVINHIIQCKPIGQAHGDKYEWTVLPRGQTENVANRLIILAMKLPEIRAAAVHILRYPKTEANYRKVVWLMHEAYQVDLGLSEWPFALPRTWFYEHYATHANWGTDVANGDVYPGNVDEYCDIWIANVWNSYRCCRIFASAMVLNCIEWLRPTQWSDLALDEGEIVATLQVTVDDICASFPYQLGHHSNDLSKCNPNAALGAYFLIWPAFVARSVSCIPQIQRQWFTNRLRYIGNRFGIGQATVLAELPTRMVPRIPRVKGRMNSVTDCTPSKLPSYQASLEGDTLL
ncbi:hypothetical protein MMC25_003683 [Agyrium rufum]|nr:hypothetical protein [Agyrium rufum]